MQWEQHSFSPQKHLSSGLSELLLGKGLEARVGAHTEPWPLGDYSQCDGGRKIRIQMLRLQDWCLQEVLQKRREWAWLFWGESWRPP